jgi:4-aminobutyrate aminotransferase-like enzyme
VEEAPVTEVAPEVAEKAAKPRWQEKLQEALQQQAGSMGSSIPSEALADETTSKEAATETGKAVSKFRAEKVIGSTWGDQSAQRIRAPLAFKGSTKKGYIEQLRKNLEKMEQSETQTA